MRNDFRGKRGGNKNSKIERGDEELEEGLDFWIRMIKKGKWREKGEIWWGERREVPR